jgi:hypothetical protein
MADVSESYKITQEMLKELMGWYNIQIGSYDNISQTEVTRLAIMALAQWCATLAVDVAMPEDKLLKVVGACYRESHKKAPRFG